MKGVIPYLLRLLQSEKSDAHKSIVFAINGLSKQRKIFLVVHVLVLTLNFQPTFFLPWMVPSHIFSVY